MVSFEQMQMESELRARDAMIKEREQMIQRLKLQLLQAKQASEENLGSKERLSQQAESVTDKADLLLKQQVIEELKNQLHVSVLV